MRRHCGNSAQEYLTQSEYKEVSMEEVTPKLSPKSKRREKRHTGPEVRESPIMTSFAILFIKYFLKSKICRSHIFLLQYK